MYKTAGKCIIEAIIYLYSRRGQTPPPPPKGLIKAKFTYFLHFFSFLDQTCQIDYDC